MPPRRRHPPLPELAHRVKLEHLPQAREHPRFRLVLVREDDAEGYEGSRKDLEDVDEGENVGWAFGEGEVGEGEAALEEGDEVGREGRVERLGERKVDEVPRCGGEVGEDLIVVERFRVESEEEGGERRGGGEEGGEEGGRLPVMVEAEVGESEGK